MTRPLRELEATARQIGRRIGGSLPDGVGFCLMIFDLGEGGHMTYLSNAERDDMVKGVRELLEAVEAGLMQPPGHPEPGQA